MGYHQKENDDDLWSCRQVQELLGLWSTDPQERGHYVHDEGSWRQHSERCCRSWCARWLRQVQVCLHSMENVPGIIWVLLSSLYSNPKLLLFLTPAMEAFPEQHTCPSLS